MSNPLDEVFKELQPGIDFPGKRPLRKLDTINMDEPADVDWDHKPIFLHLRGEVTEFFLISHLAAALGRQTVTIRSWEQKGWLPQATYRAPSPRSEQIPGKAIAGRRLYTRVQIEAVITAARQYKVMEDSGRNADWKNFRRAVLAAWKTPA